MSRLALEVDIKFNLAQFRFQSFTILNPNKTLLMKIPIYCTLNNRMQQKIKDGLIKQSKIALFMLNFNAFKKAL